jgi:hypothetical protein
MIKPEAIDVFREHFAGRYNVSIEKSTALAQDWAEAFMPFGKEVVIQTLKKLFEESTTRPSISKFKQTAYSIGKSMNAMPENIDVTPDYCKKIYVQLIDNSDMRSLNKQRIGSFYVVLGRKCDLDNPDIMRKKAEYDRTWYSQWGGKWRVIDFFDNPEIKIPHIWMMDEKDRLQREAQ